MKVSEFIGKTIKNIVREEAVSGGETLVIFDDNSTMLIHESGNPFFTPEGDSTHLDIAEVSFTEFWNYLS